jgi:hypothetical protein
VADLGSNTVTATRGGDTLAHIESATLDEGMAQYASLAAQHAFSFDVDVQIVLAYGTEPFYQTRGEDRKTQLSA